MGSYAHFHLNIILKKNTPKQIINILKYMLRKIKTKPDFPEHAFFKIDDWDSMFITTSAYHDIITMGILGKTSNKNYILSVQSQFQNYYNKIELFLKWIDPYILCEFLGYMQSPEGDLTLIYKNCDYDFSEHKQKYKIITTSQINKNISLIYIDISKPE
jgi:hypothetical protein